MSILRTFWNRFSDQEHDRETVAAPKTVASAPTAVSDVTIAPDDPLLAYFQSAPGVVEIDRLEIDSPALAELKARDVRLVIPLVSQGEMIGLINLGPRLSEQEYSADDRKLLSDLATQAAPAVRVAQLARQQQAEARERERMEHELRVARLIQQTLLPHDVPHLPGWQVSAYYQPARAVGGDFYDFIYFEDGHVGLIVGDVTDKGVPAALVMATTRTLLRAAAERLNSPGAVLERVNELLHPDIPPKMFVTCLYALLDPHTGHLRYANAGHDVPYRRHAGGVDELRATGMPLGLMPGMDYEEKEMNLSPGETVLFHSDGLVEAHSSSREMFGFNKLKTVMAGHPGGETLIDYLLAQLAQFTGDAWEQEDDVTLVTLHYETAVRQSNSAHDEAAETAPKGDTMSPQVGNDGWLTLAEFTLPSQPGNERRAMERVADELAEMRLAPTQVEKLKTAVAEATMNAMEHGNKYDADRPVNIELCCTDTAVAVRITDQGGGQEIPPAETPDLNAKLEGRQSPRGWGLFLIENMVDEMNVTSDDHHHTIELIMNRENA